MMPKQTIVWGVAMVSLAAVATSGMAQDVPPQTVEPVAPPPPPSPPPPPPLPPEPDATDAKPGRFVMVGMGVQLQPRFPGSSRMRVGPQPVFNIWHRDRPMDVETPDESFGPTLIRAPGLRAGIAIGVAPQRKASDIPGLRKVGFGMEPGLFAETYVARNLRLRGEARYGVGAHDALTGDVALDWVHRLPDRYQRSMITFGPRVRLGSADFTNRYWGVTATEAADPRTLGRYTAYRAKGGVYAVGAVGSLYQSLNHRWGVYGMAGYDRLVGSAADSPIVTNRIGDARGSRDQFTVGAAVTYVFGKPIARR